MNLASIIAGIAFLANSGAGEAAARARAVEDARRSLSQSIAAANADPQPVNEETSNQAPARLDQPLVCLTLDDIARATARIDGKGASALYELLAVDALEAETGKRHRELELATTFLAAGFAEEAAHAGKESGAAAGLTIARLSALALAPASVAPMHERCGVFDGFSERAGAHARGESKMTAEDWKIFGLLPARLRHEISDALASAALARGDTLDAVAIRRASLADMPATMTGTTSARLIDALESDDDSSLAALSEIAAEPGALQTRALEALSQRIDRLDPPAREALTDDLSDAAAKNAPMHERSSVDRSRLRIIEHGLASKALAERVDALSHLSKRPDLFDQLPETLKANALSDLEALGAHGALSMLGVKPKSKPMSTKPSSAKVAAVARVPKGANLGEAQSFSEDVAAEIARLKAELQP
jgi:hypothetical protein